MDYFNFRDALDDYRFTYNLTSKARVIAKVVSIGVANTAIFTSRALPAAAQMIKEQVEEQKKNQGK